MSIRDWFTKQTEADKSDPFDPLDQMQAKKTTIDTVLVNRLITYCENVIEDLTEERDLLRLALNRMEERLDVMEKRIDFILVKETDARELRKIFINFLEKCGFQKYKGEQHVEDGHYPDAS